MDLIYFNQFIPFPEVRARYAHYKGSFHCVQILFPPHLYTVSYWNKDILLKTVDMRKGRTVVPSQTTHISCGHGRLPFFSQCYRCIKGDCDREDVLLYFCHVDSTCP